MCRCLSRDSHLVQTRVVSTQVNSSKQAPSLRGVQPNSAVDVLTTLSEALAWSSEGTEA
jgi:hypothetical protein